jgi:hypothetical protein
LSTTGSRACCRGHTILRVGTTGGGRRSDALKRLKILLNYRADYNLYVLK